MDILFQYKNHIRCPSQSERLTVGLKCDSAFIYFGGGRMALLEAFYFTLSRFLRVGGNNLKYKKVLCI